MKEQMTAFEIAEIKKKAYKYGLIFLILNSILSIISTLIFISGFYFLLIPILILRVLQAMYATIFCYDAAEFNIGYPGLWFLFALINPSIALLFSSATFMLRKEFRLNAY